MASRVEWVFLGAGKYNEVFCTSVEYTIEGQTCCWVRKTFKDDDFDFDSDSLCNSARAVRKWNSINPTHKAWEINGGWIAPYFGDQESTDAEIAQKVVDVFRETGEIIVDAYGFENCLTYEEQVFCVDVDLALHRDSEASDGYYNNILIKAYDCYASCYQESKPLAIEVIKTLLYIEAQLAFSVIKYDQINRVMVDKLQMFRLEELPISTTMMALLAKIPESTLVCEHLTPKMLIEVDEQCQRSQDYTLDFILERLKQPVPGSSDADVDLTPVQPGFSAEFSFFKSLKPRQTDTQDKKRVKSL